MRNELRHVVRELIRNPGFTAVAVLTLALGIGANTAIFTLIQQAMLRQLPVAQPDQLWRIGENVRCCYSTGYAQNNWSFFSWDAYKTFRANTQAFEDLAAFQAGNALLGLRREGSSGTVTTANGQYVSGNFFKTLGVSAWRGRLFTDSDDRAGALPVAVLSYHAWQQKYGLDPSVIGAAYQINSHPFTIVGVAPPDFFGAKLASGSMPDVWLPLTTEPTIEDDTSRLENPGTAWLFLIGRVRPHTQMARLEGQLQVELRQWLASREGEMTPKERAAQQTQTLHLTPGGAGVSLLGATYKESLLLLLFAAFCVLLVAAANIANLMLARALKDRSQAALRVALGAGRARLVSKALCESLAVALLGAVVGIAVAYGAASLLLRLAFAPDAWIPVTATPSMPALLFAMGVSVLTAVLCGIAPAWMASRADPVEGLRGTGRHTGHHRQRAQKTLVIAQVAMSMVLLSMAAMLGQSLGNLQQKNFGFDPRDRYLVYVNAKLAGYEQEQLVPLFRQVADRLRAIPGVRNVSPALYAPMSGYSWGREIQVAGRRDLEPTSIAWTRVAPAFFETLDNTIVRGRPINESDTANTRPVAVVNEAFARKFFANENPLGQRFGPAPHADLYEIVGVASDMRYFADAWDAVPMYFVPHAQTSHFDNASLESREVWSHYFNTIIVWAPGAPPHVEEQVMNALANLDLAVYVVQPYAEVIRVRYAEQNMVATVAWLFGTVGLVLAAVGLYGVAAYGVEQRTREIGVRTALGADSRSVMVMVLRGTLTQLGIGLALGIPAAIAVGHWVASKVFGVSPWDPTMLAGAALVLGLAASMAAAVPARRAARVDPLVALRSD